MGEKIFNKKLKKKKQIPINPNVTPCFFSDSKFRKPIETKPKIVSPKQAFYL